MPGNTVPACAICAFLMAPAPVLAQTVSVDGAELTIVDEGEGVPVIFVHGAISDHRVWEPLRGMIAENRRFIAYDQRYFGTADWPDEAEHFTIDTHADDLIAVIEALDAGPAHVVTWSYSGDVAARAAIKRPDLFRAMVHYEPAIPSLLDGLPGADQATQRMFAGFAPAMAAVQDGRAEDSALRFIEAVFDLPEGAAASEAEPGPTIWRENGRTVAPYLKAPEGETVSCEAAGRIGAPTLIVQGGTTFTRFSMMAERLGQCQPNAVVATLADVNHDGPHRKPLEFGAMIEGFLTAVE